MADKDIIQYAIARHGQSQAERTAKELGVHWADVDERSTTDLMKFVRELAPFVKLYPSDGGAPTDWSPLFGYTDDEISGIINDMNGSLEPHLALLAAFFELYKRPQKIINEITGRHLDFYYRDVLRLSERAATPDHAHLLLELKKGAAPVLVSTDHSFSAGKDATNVELIYTPVRDTVINGSAVDSLRTVYLDRNPRGTIRYAPIANSADGLGGEFTGTETQWSAFGSTDLRAGEVGFALAAMVLRMQEGVRSVTAKLTLANADASVLTSTALQNAFDVFLSGEEGWIGPLTATATLNSSVLQLQFTLDASQPAVVDYDAAIHGYAYGTGAPVMQVQLRSGSSIAGYLDLQNVTIKTVEIVVSVTGVTSLTLESDAGTLDPKKAFLPFGPQPTAGSRCLIGYEEALTKRLSRIDLAVQWKDAPSNFYDYYKDYGVTVYNSSFAAGVTYSDGTGQTFTDTAALFDSTNATTARTISLVPGSPSVAPYATPSMQVYALNAVGTRWASFAVDRFVLGTPVFAAARTTPPPLRTGYISLALGRDFLHSTYRKKLVENVVASTKSPYPTLVMLNEPYSPTVQTISLSYTAHTTTVNIQSNSLEDFAAADVHFYHVTPSGPRREHAYLRRQLEFLSENTVPLVPAYPHDGELQIGVSNLEPGDSVSLLFQVAEGSANPDLQPPTVDWYVLSNNYWKSLESGELALETTNGLLASGIVSIVISSDATTNNTVMPPGYVWIKAGIKGDVTAVCKLIQVAAGAVEVSFTDNGNDPTHLSSALAAGSIKKLKTPIGVVKTVTQPYASFDGAPIETSDSFYTRVSERLRHKNRCITIWDYERIVLEAFPRVHRVKCIPHAKDGAWEAPGNLLIVVIPDLRNKNAYDPLEPRVDADTIDRIGEHVAAHAGLGVQARVKNPRYKKIHLDFKVKFHAGYDFNYYRAALETALIQTLSPWAFDEGRELLFGGRIYKSVLLDVVEELEYVDYVTDFKMYSSVDGVLDSTDRNDVQADTPDMVIVSDDSHTINEV